MGISAAHAQSTMYTDEAAWRLATSASVVETFEGATAMSGNLLPAMNSSYVTPNQFVISLGQTGFWGTLEVFNAAMLNSANNVDPLASQQWIHFRDSTVEGTNFAFPTSQSGQSSWGFQYNMSVNEPFLLTFMSNGISNSHILPAAGSKAFIGFTSAPTSAFSLHSQNQFGSGLSLDNIQMPVPEPSSLLMTLAGLMTCAYIYRRKITADRRPLNN